jgi:flagellar biosynthesis protein FlhG
MIDQATTLRQMASQTASRQTAAVSNPAGASRQARSIAVTGGKGGVGKSNFAVNLTLELAAQRKKVTLLDADLGLANADLLLGINPEFHLGHFFSGKCALDRVLIELGEGVRLVPGGSGVEALANISPSAQSLLLSELEALETESDFFIIDTAAGIGENVMGVVKAATEIVVVTTPEPTAIVDAYATIKVICQRTPEKPIWLVVNNVTTLADAEAVFRQLSSATERFLQNRLAFLGAMPHDEQLVEAVREQIPVVRYAPLAPASRSMRVITKYLIEQGQRFPTQTSPTSSFWLSLARNEF